MNRSPLLTAPSSLLSPQQESFDWLGNHEIVPASSQPETRAAECYFAPVHYQESYPYPLIVWLHGPRSCENELHQVMPLISLRNYVAVAPRGTKRAAANRNIFGWTNSPDAIDQACQRVKACIEGARDRYHVHPERIFVAGYAEGGTMAYRVAMEMPELFTAAISLGGRMPQGSRPWKHIKQTRQLQLMLSVSPDSEYPLEAVMQDVKYSHLAGSPLDLRLFPEGDRLTTEMFKDMNHWVLQQACPTTIVA